MQLQESSLFQLFISILLFICFTGNAQYSISVKENMTGLIVDGLLEPEWYSADSSLLFAQHNSTNDKYYFYGLFGWRFKPPFGALYLIVNTDDYYDFDERDDYFSRIVFLKLTYPLVVIGQR